MAYLKRDGTTVGFLPDLEDYVKDEPDASIEERYVVELLDENRLKVASEDVGSKYPSKEVLKWCLLKHKAAYANVKRLYELAF